MGISIDISISIGSTGNNVSIIEAPTSWAWEDGLEILFENGTFVQLEGAP